MDQNASADDPWLFLPRRKVTSGVGSDGLMLRMDMIENVLPVDREFGKHPREYVPARLIESLFPAHLSNSGAPTTNTFTDTDAKSLTYVILDAAKIFGLPDVLADTGLDHCCLFTGKALHEMGDVSPWIVKLEERHPFTRRLFSASRPFFDNSGLDAALFFRSSADLQVLQQHFRRFTRLRDSAGKWFLLRFWTECFWTASLTFGEGSNCRVHAGILEKIDDALLKADHPDAYWAIRPERAIEPIAGPPLLDDELLKALNLEVERRSARHEIRYALGQDRDVEIKTRELRPVLEALHQWLKASGFAQSEQRSCAMRLLVSKGLADHSVWPRSLKNMLSDASRDVGIRLWMLENKDWS